MWSPGPNIRITASTELMPLVKAVAYFMPSISASNSSSTCRVGLDERV